MKKLSVAIITFNEELNIQDCLDSVKDVADEIVVVDSLSTDGTKEICQGNNVVFIEQPFLGHIQQKNFAKQKCSHDLVLSLDADERLSESLKKEILAVKQNQEFDGYRFPRLNHYCGKAVKHGGWYPDYSLRLWTRTKGEWGGNNPHDKFFMNKDASVGVLQGDLLHYTFRTVEQHLAQIEKFSTISAQSKFAKGKKSSAFKIAVYPFWRFFRNYFIKLGFLDGKTGFLIAFYSMHAVELKYVKLKKLHDAAKQK